MWMLGGRWLRDYQLAGMRACHGFGSHLLAGVRIGGGIGLRANRVRTAIGLGRDHRG